MLAWLRYQVLHRPLKLAVRFDRSSTNPSLTVIFLHGIAASSRTWQPSLEQLSRDPAFNACRLVALDWLGFGHSPHARWLRYTYTENLTALSYTLKTLNITTPVILVGHSMGALLATKYALLHPSHVQQLILVSPPLIMPKDIAKVPDQFYLKTYANLSELARTPGGKAVATFANQLTSFESKYLHTPAFARSMKNIILSKHNYDNFLKLKVPTTIIHGRLDPLVYAPNLEKVTKRNPHIRLVFSTSHHDIDPAKFARISQTLKRTINTSPRKEVK